jgi:peptidoglycan hydrolase-like protein with peptidoglycan-binding domain
MTQLNQLPNGGNWLNSRNSSSLDSASAADFRIARERSPRIAPRISSSSSRASAAESSISQNRFNHRTSQSSNTNQYPVQSGDSLWTKTQARRLPEGLSSNGIAHKGNFNTVSHQKKNTESRNSLNILNEAVTGTFIATNSTNKKLPQTNSLDVKRARAFGSATEMAWKQEGEVRPNVDRVIGQTTWKNADTLPTMPFPGAASRRPDTFVKLKNSQGIGNVLGATPKLAAEPTTFNAPKISDNSDSLIGNVASVNRELVLDLAIANAKKQLQSFANDEKMLDKMSQAFGDDWHPQKGHTLIQDLAVGRAMPKIEILPATNLNGNGAFGGETIYLSEPFLNKNAANSEAVANVLVEEIGHYVDRELNYIDSPGDEGEIFARLVRDETINRAELGAIKAENDRATILLDGKELTVELSESSYRGMSADAMERQAQADLADKAASYPGYALIYNPSVPEYNEDPNAVKMWQQRMKDLGYDIDVDGYYGGQSVQVARQFQAANELEVDGKVGPITWGASFSLGTPTADSTAATSSSPIGTADAMERRAQADLADKADAANTPEGDTPEGRSDAYFRLVRLGDPETGVPAGYELGVAALRYGDPEGPHEAGMLFFDGKRGLIREEGNTRFGEQARLGVLNMNANVLEGLQNSGEVSESTIGIFDLNALGNLTGEATVGNDGFTVGAAASLGDASYTGGTINPESSTDLTGRVGLGYGEGAAVRGHWDDADNDSYRE